jgi:hypothetical protein
MDQGRDKIVPDTPTALILTRSRSKSTTVQFQTPACESPLRPTEPPTDNDLEEHGYCSSPVPRHLSHRPAEHETQEDDDEAPISTVSGDPFLDKIQELMHHANGHYVHQQVMTMLTMTGRDAVANWSGAYSILSARLRSTSAPREKDPSTSAGPTNSKVSNEITILIPSLGQFVELFRRDLDCNGSEGVTHEALKLLGYFLYNPMIYSQFSASQIMEILKMVLTLTKDTQDKTTCHLCIWIWRMQRLPSKLFSNPLLSALMEMMAYALKAPFQSSTIPSEAIQGLDVLFRLIPKNILLLAPIWLLPLYACTTVPNDLVRKHAIEFFSFHLPSIAEELDHFDSFLSSFYERNNARLIYEITELTNRNERDGMKLWSVAIVLFSKYIQKSPSFVNGMLKIVERCFNVKKASSKLYGYRSWSFLVFSFAITRYLLHERRLKLLMIPILNSFTHDRHVQLRMEATSCWIKLVFALSLCSSHKDFSEFFSLIEGALPKILVDDSSEIRASGWMVFEALTRCELGTFF